MIRIVVPSLLLKYVFYFLFLTFIVVGLLFDNGYVTETFCNTALHYLRYVALIYIGVVLGVLWATQYEKFVALCRRSFVDGVWQSDAIKDYLLNQSKYASYWLLKTISILVVVLLNVVLCVLLFYPVSFFKKYGVLATAAWWIGAMLIYGVTVSFLADVFTKNKPNFYMRLNALMDDLKKY